MIKRLRQISMEKVPRAMSPNDSVDFDVPHFFPSLDQPTLNLADGQSHYHDYHVRYECRDQKVCLAREDDPHDGRLFLAEHNFQVVPCSHGREVVPCSRGREVVNENWNRSD